MNVEVHRLIESFFGHRISTTPWVKGSAKPQASLAVRRSRGRNRFGPRGLRHSRFRLPE
jgi:hypothetical protein